MYINWSKLVKILVFLLKNCHFVFFYVKIVNFWFFTSNDFSLKVKNCQNFGFLCYNWSNFWFFCSNFFSFKVKNGQNWYENCKFSVFMSNIVFFRSKFDLQLIGWSVLVGISDVWEIPGCHFFLFQGGCADTVRGSGHHDEILTVSAEVFLHQRQYHLPSIQITINFNQNQFILNQVHQFHSYDYAYFVMFKFWF